MDLAERIADAIVERGLKSGSGLVLVLDRKNLLEAIASGMKKYTEVATDTVVEGGVGHLVPKHG